MSGYYNDFFFYRSVAYFDQHLGAAQVKHWSKYLHIFGVKKHKEAGKSIKISQKKLFCTPMLVEGFYSQKKTIRVFLTKNYPQTIDFDTFKKMTFFTCQGQGHFIYILGLAVSKNNWHTHIVEPGPNLK